MRSGQCGVTTRTQRVLDVRRQERLEARRDDPLRDLPIRVLLKESIKPAVLLRRQLAPRHPLSGLAVVHRDRDAALRAHRLEDLAVRHVHHRDALDIQRALDELRSAVVHPVHRRPADRVRVRRLVRWGIDLEALAAELLHLCIWDEF